VEEDLSFPIAQPIEDLKPAETSVVQSAAGEKSRCMRSYHTKKCELKKEESAKDRSLWRYFSVFPKERDCSCGLPDNFLASSFTPRFLPPLFEKEFEEENDMQINEQEVAELEIRTKKNKPNDDWAKRGEGVHDLLILQQHGILGCGQYNQSSLQLITLYQKLSVTSSTVFHRVFSGGKLRRLVAADLRDAAMPTIYTVQKRY